MDDAGLVRRYDELERISRGCDVAVMDAMAFIDLVLDTGAMPPVSE